MSRFFFLLVSFLLCFVVDSSTQENVARADTLVVNKIPDEQPDSLLQVDNSQTVELIQLAKEESLANSLKEALLNEQISALREDSRQRRLLEQQLDEMRSADSVRKAGLYKQIDSLKQHAVKAPVILKRDTICYIYTKLGSFTPKERAAINSEKIRKVARMFSLKTDSLLVSDSGNSSDIMYGEVSLISVTDMDAYWMNTTRQELAEEYKARILESIAVYKKEVSLWNILRQIGLALLVIGLQYALVKGTNYLFRRIIDRRIVSKKDEWFTGIRIRNLEILDSAKQVKTLLFVSKMIRYLMYLFLFYLTIPLLFSIFPLTQKYAYILFGWVLTPVGSLASGFIAYLPKLLKIIVIVIVMRYIVKFFRYIMGEIESRRLEVPGFYPEWARTTFNLLRIFLYAFMLVMIFPLLPNADSDTFKGVSVFLGVVFSLGSTAVVGNMVAGLVITYMRPFKVGDRIKIGEIFGDVIEKTPFVVRVMTYRKEVITVPNSTILTTNVVNYSSSVEDQGVILHTTVTMGYEVPWREMERLLIEAGLRTGLVLKNPSPFVLQTALNDFAASYQLCVYTKDPGKQAGIYSELHHHIQDVFRDAGIEMITPHYRAYRDGNEKAIPPGKTAESPEPCPENTKKVE